jgi:hypothetical protein
MFGDKRVIDEGAFERAQQGISDRNKTAYQNYVNNINQSYDDLGFLGKLATGVSGGGWGKSNYLKNYGITDEIDALGKAGNINTTGMNSLYDAGNAYSQQRLKQLNQGQGLFSGIPLVGSIIDPFAQLTSGAKDLVESGTSKWDKGDRSLVSDIGAGIEAGLTVASLGSLSKAKAAAKAGTSLAPTTLKSAIAKGAGRGAIYGGIGSLGNYLNVAGDQASVGDAALQTAMGAGIGGVLGGGLSGAGYGIGKLRSNAVAGNQKVGEAAKKATEANAAVSSYQDALQTAKNVGLDTSSEEALKKSYNAFMKANHPDKVAAQAQQNQIIALLPEHASQSTISPYTDAVTKGTGTGYVSTYDIMTPEAKAINAQAVENAQKLASETVKPVSEAYNTLSGASLADLLGESKAANQALKKASNQALLDYLKGTKLGKLGSSKLGKAAAVGGTAYGISRLLGNRNGGNNE